MLPTEVKTKTDFTFSPVGLIPKDWTCYELHEITSKERPISYGIVQTGINVEGGVKCIRVININENKINEDDLITTTTEISQSYKRTILKKDDLIMPLRGKVGEVAKVPISLVGANLTRGVALISPLKKISPDFLQQQISSMHTRKILEQSLNGSALQEISIGLLRKIKVAIPNNFSEQTAIAEILSTCDVAIEKTNLLISKKEKRKKALMQNLLTGKVRFKEFANAEWGNVLLGDVTNIVMGQSPDSISYNSDGNGIPLLQGNADIKNRVSTPRIYTNKPTKVCNVGDVLMTVRAPVGAIAKSLHHACIGRGICAFKANQIDSEFLYQILLNFEPKWVEFEQGSTFTSVSSTDIKELEISIPNDKNEQVKIGSVLSFADIEIQKLKSQLEKLKLQKKGLMQLLLTGKVRIKI